MSESCRQKDLIRSRLLLAMLGLSAALVAAQIFWRGAHDWFSIALLSSWAVFCAANARRCGRRHCYFTAPILAVSALAILLLELGVMDFPGYWINVFLIGGIALSCLAEMTFGAYFRSAQQRTASDRN